MSKKCPNCGACPECGARPPVTVQPWQPWMVRPYPYTHPYTQPYTQQPSTLRPNTAGGYSGGTVSYSNPVNH